MTLTTRNTATVAIATCSVGNRIGDSRGLLLCDPADFGDSWEHEIVGEQILPDGSAELAPPVACRCARRADRLTRLTQMGTLRLTRLTQLGGCHVRSVRPGVDHHGGSARPDS